jgi:hypothetical protein
LSVAVLVGLLQTPVVMVVRAAVLDKIAQLVELQLLDKEITAVEITAVVVALVQLVQLVMEQVVLVLVALVHQHILPGDWQLQLEKTSQASFIMLAVVVVTTQFQQEQQVVLAAVKQVDQRPLEQPTQVERQAQTLIALADQVLSFLKLLALTQLEQLQVLQLEL